MQNFQTLLKSQQSLLLSCQDKLCVNFNDKTLFLQALCHSSYANEQKNSSLSNERLEFLGDAVLDLVIVEYLYKVFSNHSEGQLTQMKANLVCEATLAKLANHLDLGNCLLLNKGEERDGGRHKAALLADALEAIIGAIYIDQGLDIARQFILNIYEPYLLELEKDDSFLLKDAKSRLNEYRQKAGKTLPTYIVLREWGDDHAKHYEMGIFFDELLVAQGVASNKKAAAQAAAQSAYQKLIKEKNV